MAQQYRIHLEGRRFRLLPWARKIPRRRKLQPLQLSLDIQSYIKQIPVPSAELRNELV